MYSKNDFRMTKAMLILSAVMVMMAFTMMVNANQSGVSIFQRTLSER